MVSSTPKQQAYWTNRIHVLKLQNALLKEAAAETSGMVPFLLKHLGVRQKSEILVT